MQLTMKRNMKFLGQDRKVGDVVDVTVGPGVGQITDRLLRVLVDDRAVESPEMSPSSGGSGMETHLRAKVDNLEGQVKKLTAEVSTKQKAYDDLAGRVAKLEGVGGTVRTRRQARANQE